MIGSPIRRYAPHLLAGSLAALVIVVVIYLSRKSGGPERSPDSLEAQGGVRSEPPRRNLPPATPESSGPESAKVAATRYELILERLTWTQARRRCVEMGGKLATLRSKAQNGVLAALLAREGKPGSCYWIGLTRDPRKDQWTWIDGSSCAYTNWIAADAGIAVPNGDYGVIVYSSGTGTLGQWKDVEGPDNVHDAVDGFVCELPVADPVPGMTPSGAAEFKGHRYAFFRDQVTWFWAKTRCEEMGGHLATISSREEDHFVASLLPRERDKETYFWIGFTDETQKFTWRWIDGDSSKYRNWRPGEPNNASGNEGYVAMTSSQLGSLHGTWVDMEGPHRLHDIIVGFVCEWDDEASLLARVKRSASEVKKAALTREGHRYLPVIEAVTWNQAKLRCEEWGGHLLTVETKEEWGFVASTLLAAPPRQSYYWIGLTDAPKPGTWGWLGGAKLEHPRWLPGEPNNFEGREHFAALLAAPDPKSHGYANDFEGPDRMHNSVVGFICEWDN